MIKNLVLSSGSIIGISYLGCLQILEERNLVENIENILGCSVGALFGLYMCLGYNSSELHQILKKVNFSDLTNIEYDDIINFTENLGLQDGIKIMKITEIMIKAKTKNPDITFSELYNLTKKNLIVLTTCLTDRKEEYFNYILTPDVKIIDAVRMSISIPFLFKPVIYKNKYYVDGAVINSYPMDYFKDEMDKTLGILIHTLGSCNIKNIEDFCLSILFCSLINKKNDTYEKYKHNTILISKYTKACSGFEFSIDDEVKEVLIKIGRDQCEKALDSDLLRSLLNNIDDLKEDNTKQDETNLDSKDIGHNDIGDNDIDYNNDLGDNDLNDNDLNDNDLDDNDLNDNDLDDNNLDDNDLDDNDLDDNFEII